MSRITGAIGSCRHYWQPIRGGALCRLCSLQVERIHNRHSRRHPLERRDWHPLSRLAELLGR